MDGAVFGPCCSDDGFEVLSRGEGLRLVLEELEMKVLTFALGGEGFGLHAFLTTFSNEDI